MEIDPEPSGPAFIRRGDHPLFHIGFDRRHRERRLFVNFYRRADFGNLGKMAEKNLKLKNNK